jgi:hypothetical protein
MVLGMTGRDSMPVGMTGWNMTMMRMLHVNDIRLRLIMTVGGYGCPDCRSDCTPGNSTFTATYFRADRGANAAPDSASEDSIGIDRPGWQTVE